MFGCCIRSPFAVVGCGRPRTPVNCILAALAVGGAVLLASHPAHAQNTPPQITALRYDPKNPNARYIEITCPANYNSTHETWSFGPLSVSPSGGYLELVSSGSGARIYRHYQYSFNTRYTYSDPWTHWWENWEVISSYYDPEYDEWFDIYGWVGHTETGVNTSYATVRQVAASAAQTVDTRTDPRFSTWKLKNFPFADRTYRGGLFAGYNADGSKVARTYLKFSSLTGPIQAGEQIWPVGGMTLYRTRLARPGSLSLLCNAVTNDTWDPATLTWDTAPVPPSDGSKVSLAWASGGAGEFITFDVLPYLDASLASNGGDGTLSAVISHPGETVSSGIPFPIEASPIGWAYFARSNYEENGTTGYGPFLLYAYGGAGAGLTELSLISSGSVSGGSSVQAMVVSSYKAGPGGLIVRLSSSNTAVATVPTTVTIPAGASAAFFTITVLPATANTSAIISATLGSTRTATLNVTP